MQAYDLILALDGEATYNDSVMTLVRKLRGDEGTDVDLTLWRTGQEIRVTIKRGHIDADRSF